MNTMIYPRGSSAKDRTGSFNVRTLGALVRTMLGAVAAAASLLVFCGPGAAQSTSTSAQLILDGVIIVDPRDGKLTRNARITINDGKITEISPAGGPVPGGPAKYVDAREKYVVPGYLDMHAHPLAGDASPLDSAESAASLTLMLVNGITGFRQMSGSPELLEKRRSGAFQQPAAMPAVLAMPGSILTGANAATPEAAVAEVQRQKSSGADFIKVVDVGPQVFFAAEEEAKRVALPFVGHLPLAVDAVQASERGMKSIEHLGPRDSVLVGCSSDEAALREAISRIPPRKPPPLPPEVFAKLTEKIIANPIAFTDASEIARYQRVIDTYSEAKCRQLAVKFATNGTWQTPTLIRLRTMMFGNDPEYMTNPNLRYVSADTKRLWQEVAQEYSAKISPASAVTLAAFYNLQLKLVKLFQEAGVKMMAGDDYGGQWLVPGFGLHQEFDQLAHAGLSPLEVLQMTTINGAEFIGRTASMGAVEAGKDADLVLLDGDPVESVQNLHRISAVVRAGSYFSRDDLDQLKAKAVRAPR
jgi:imidazolonepropionase-like amidohydrolase